MIKMLKSLLCDGFYILKVLVTCVALLGAVGVLFAWRYLPVLPSSLLEREALAENSFFYDGENSLIGVVQGSENRYPVATAQMGKWSVDAAIAIEDERFWSHEGYDVEGIGRSAYQNFRAKNTVQGASTITQQLLRSEQPLLYEMSRWQRKIYELQLARSLEHHLEKDNGPMESKRLLVERYLNAVYYGNGAYGIEAASRTFYGKPAKNLTLAESALLAGLIQSPSGYDPYKKEGFELAKARQMEVLYRMEYLGWITPQQRTAAEAQQLHLKTIRPPRKMPYVQDEMRRQLTEWYGPTAISEGGLRVSTTISPRAQSMAEGAISAELPYASDPAASLVTIDNQSGRVVALASSSEYGRSQFNLATQAKRQPGSSAKIWALADLVDKGINPEGVRYSSIPLKIRRYGDKEWWRPQTYDRSYPGSMNLHRATLRSDNSVYAQLALDLGAKNIAQTAQKWGIKTKLPDLAPIVLGAQEVTVLEQTNFYATIARGGLTNDPQLIRKMSHQTSGSVAVPTTGMHRVAPAARVQVIRKWLIDNMRSGTGKQALLPSGRLAGGKTGTTDDYKDAWFCGFTVQYTTCVWVGYIKPRPMYNVHGEKISGGTIPARIWRRYNSALHARLERKEWRASPVYSNTWSNNNWSENGWKTDPNIEIQEPFVKPLGQRYAQ